MKAIVVPQGLRDPRCYPHAADEVEVVETHISWVFLAGNFAYKVKKPVDLGFCNFTTLERRRFYCEEELRLNRRVAPELYIDVVAIVVENGGLRIDGRGEPVEFAVKMRRFPQAMLLDSIAVAGCLEGSTIDQLARVVSRMHRSAARADPVDGRGSPAHALQLALDNFFALESRDAPESERSALARLREWTQDEFRNVRQAMEERELHGSVRECHGDLHLGNIVLLEGVPVPFDCVEFDPGLRWIDVMSDVAFVAMDLDFHGLQGLAARFLSGYLEDSGDYGGLRVMRFYRVYRALVRAKIERLRGVQRGTGATSRRADYVDLALRTTVEARPFLEIMSGVSGSGKSTVAMQRVEGSQAIRIRSDVERKRIHGMDALAHASYGLGEGIYSNADSDLVYETLAGLARNAIHAGYPVIVDASFLERRRRELFRRLAGECGVPFRIVSCEAAEQTLQGRLAQRWEAGSDASDARDDVLRKQLSTREAIGADEEGVVHVSTEETTPGT